MAAEVWRLGHILKWWLECSDLRKSSPERIKKLTLLAKECGISNWSDIPRLVRETKEEKWT